MAYGQPWGASAYMPTMNTGMPHLQGPPVHAQAQPQPQQQAQSRPNGSSGQRPGTYTLSIMQQPESAKAANGKDKGKYSYPPGGILIRWTNAHLRPSDRKPVDPPPILKLEVPANEDPDGVYRQSPYLMAVAFLEYAPSADRGDALPSANMMSGQMVSSLHRLKDPSNQEGAFFIFGDLTIRSEGHYVIRFELLQFEVGGDELGFVDHITSITSRPFQVHAGKAFPGMQESTFLTRSFSDQGVRLRLRKDSRQIVNRKRNQNVSHRLKLKGEETEVKRKGSQGMLLGQQLSNRQGGAQNGQVPQMTDESYENEQYDGPAYKRSRTTSGSANAVTPTVSEGSTESRPWAHFPSSAGQQYGSHGPLLPMSGGPSSSASMSAPVMPPPTGRLDTQFSSLHQGQGAYHSPAGERQSPMTQSPMHQSPMHHSPIQFGNASVHSTSPHPYVFGSSSNNANAHALGAPSMGQHQHSSMNAATLHNVSPRTHTQINGTTPTGTASPVGTNMYTTAPPTSDTPQPRHNHHNQYSHAAAYQNVQQSYDQSTLHEHGLHTPLTASMPSDSMSGPYDVYGAMVSKSD
ncbi:Uu.00g129970.m01.CDS01 [Anthostomella pinea]|uniref:Uu.00g129970.m01.CDS01 n=1 Tax=Anthostomella pinea TaxID=933095 RepID=A0AAI8VIJ0_9PEZI|nr:Uu.00g129970.m01.CDS01 [Anthostomella pinea]